MNNDTNGTNNVLGATNQSNNPTSVGTNPVNNNGVEPYVSTPNTSTNNTANSNPTFTVMLDKPVTETPKNPTPSPSVSTPVPPSVATPTSGIGTPSPSPNPSGTGVSPQPATPEPAYTNPQSIGSMPGFEDSSVVGTTPPISLEADKTIEKKPKKKNSLLFIIIIIGALLLVGGGTYYVLNYTNLLNGNKTTLEALNFNLNVGEELPTEISKYAKITGTDASNCTRDVSKVDINKAGTYEFSITCGGVVRKGKITVIDERPLTIIALTAYKVAGSTLEPSEFGTSDYSDVTYEFVDQNDVTTKINTPGVHTIELKATNSSGKTVNFTGKLIVTQYEVKRYYICDISSNYIDSIKATKTVNYRFVISDSPQESNIYGGLTQEINKYKFDNVTDYNSYKSLINTDKKINIDNVEGTLANTTFDDTDNSISIITKDFDNTELYTKYGENNLKTYRSISAYFGGPATSGGLGYTCRVK